MRSLRALTWLLVLLVLVPAGVLAWLGFQAADAWDTAVEAQIRRELDDAEAEVRRVGAQVLAETGRGLDETTARLAGRVRDELPLSTPGAVLGHYVGQSFWLVGEEARADSLVGRVLGMHLVDADGRRMDRVEYVPSDGHAPGTDVEALFEDLRREADRRRFGDGDPEAALAVWSEARERMPGDLLRARCDVEAALVVVAGDADASEVAESIEDRWSHDLLLRVGRPAVRLWIAAGLADATRWWPTLADPRIDAVPLTAEERRTVRAIVSMSVIDPPGEPTRDPRPSIGREAEVASGARLRVRYDAGDLWVRIGDRIRSLGAWGAVVPTAIWCQGDLPRHVERQTETTRTLSLSNPGGPDAAVVLSHREAAARLGARKGRRRMVGVGVLSLLLLTMVGLVLVRRAVRREQDASRLRDDFIANVSHELRTPLTSVCLHAEMLADEDPPADRRRELARVVKAEGGRLAALVDDLLDFAALEQGVRRIEPEPVDLACAVREAAAPYETLAEREGAVLEVDVPEGELVAMADAHALGRILANLLSNAWRHGRPSRDGAPGRIRIRATGTPTPTVEVRDDGAGIPADERGTVFERFRRGRRSKRVEGTGLGLALGRELALAMDGNLELVDDPTHTVFRLTLRPVPDLEP